MNLPDFSLRCGCDLAQISRWVNPSERLIRRIFTAREIDLLLARFNFSSLGALVVFMSANVSANVSAKDSAAGKNYHAKNRKIAEFLAARFAAKEAASKALGCGIGAEFGFLDAEILPSEKMAPILRFSEQIARKFHIHQAALSISHDGDFALAMCTLL